MANSRGTGKGRFRRRSDASSTPRFLLGCDTCEVSEALPTAAAVAAFFEIHAEGHRTWIDLSGGGFRLPE
jgi:hypothetical protein